MKEQLAETKHKIDQTLSQIFTNELSNPKNQHPHIQQTLTTLQNFTLRSGKRVRGALAYHTYKMLVDEKDFTPKTEEKLLQITAAIELNQAYLLIEDDIVDQTDYRRNEDTVHKEYEHYHKQNLKENNINIDSEHFGESVAQIIGLVASHMASELIANSGFPSKTISKATKYANRFWIQTGYGELMDIIFEADPPIKSEDVLQMLLLKTGRYTATTPVVIAAIFAETSDKLISTLSQFGDNLGTAFQIQDDILGTFGTDKLGKPTDDDLKEGKYTLLTLKAIELADKKDREFMKDNLGDRDMSTETADQMRDIIKKSGAYDFTKEQAKQHANSSLKTFDKIEDNVKSEDDYIFINDVVDFLISRDY